MEIWTRTGTGWSKEEGGAFPDATVSLEERICERLLAKEHHFLVFTREELKELTRMARSFITMRDEGDVARDLLELFVKGRLGGFLGPCPVAVVYVKDVDSQRDRLACELFRP